MMCTRIGVFVAGVTLTASNSLAEPPLLRFDGVGVGPNGTSSIVYGLSADGTRAVGTDQSSTELTAFAWTNAQGQLTLAPWGGDSIAIPLAASGDGSVIVGVSGSPDQKPVKWAPGPSATLLPQLSLSGTGRVAGVSADGAMMVGYSTQSGVTMASRWTSAGILPLGSLANGRNSQAIAISGNGSVIAGISQTAASNEYVATRWTQAGSPISIGVLPGGSGSNATATNFDGSVVVGFGNASGYSQRAFRWTTATGVVALDMIPGSGGCLAYATSGDGNTVGGTYSTSEGSRAFVWTPSQGMVDLTGLATSLGLDLSGWTLSEVRAVSADGLTFAGVGVHRLSPEEARFEGFVLTIPAPPSVALALGISVLLVRRRSR